MENLSPLKDFFLAIQNDGRISITHIGVFAALFYYRMAHGDRNPIDVFRTDIMSIAKLSSHGTYFKCLKDLNDYGYLRYEASYNPRKPSRIYFNDQGGVSPANDLVQVAKDKTSIQQGEVKAVSPPEKSNLIRSPDEGLHRPSKGKVSNKKRGHSI